MLGSPQIEYFYSAHSAYAYLGAWELDRIAKKAGATIIHRPFDFSPVISAAGSQTFAQRSAAHLDYFFGREMVRWAHWRNLPMIRHRPTHHDNALNLASGMIIAAGRHADVVSRTILQAHWRDDVDIADPKTLVDLLRQLDLDGEKIRRQASTAEVQDQFNQFTQEAIERHVLGSPTYFLDGDMFYGQDRLHMVEHALQDPFPS
ncbi:MAG: 2-hydroxychromene-2-carboxylate isomerase [Pseudomonadota bacterium]